MKKQTWTLSLIIVICIALFPGTLLAAVATVNPISSVVHPGSPIIISGTSDLSQVIIKVLRPNQSILYFNVAPVADGKYNDTITLGQTEVIGTYQILVGQGSEVTTTPIVVTTSPVVVAPTASPIAGEVTKGTSVTLSSSTAGATIYYTIDGSAPTANSILYSTPIIINAAKTVKAIAVRDGMTNSHIMSVSYTIKSSEVEITPDPKPEPDPEPKPTVPIDLKPTVPAATVVTDISGASGGEVASQHAKIAFPSKSFTGQFKVTITPVTDVTSLVTSSNSFIVGEVLSITKDIAGDFNSPITITMNVEVADIDSAKYEYGVYWYNEKTKEWVILDNIQFDPTTGQISGDVNHFTMFTVLATEKKVVVEEPIITPIALKDIKGHWAEKHIQQLVDLGAISGYPDSTFLPNNSITRAEFVQALVKAYGLEEQGDRVFLDTAGHWAQQSISTAVANGIVSGYDANHFGPNDPITREQIASMIMRAAKFSPGTDNSSITDRAEISQWAEGSVAALVQRGIITGYVDGSFKPLKAATRAEAVTMILLSIQQ